MYPWFYDYKGAKASRYIELFNTDNANNILFFFQLHLHLPLPFQRSPD